MLRRQRRVSGTYIDRIIVEISENQAHSFVVGSEFIDLVYASSKGRAIPISIIHVGRSQHFKGSLDKEGSMLEGQPNYRDQLLAD